MERKETDAEAFLIGESAPVVLEPFSLPEETDMALVRTKRFFKLIRRYPIEATVSALVWILIAGFFLHLTFWQYVPRERSLWGTVDNRSINP